MTLESTEKLFQQDHEPKGPQSRLGRSLRYAVRHNKPITVKDYFKYCCDNKLDRIVGIVKGGTVIVVGISGGILYGVAALEMAEEDGSVIAWEVILIGEAFGTNVLGTAYCTADILLNQLNAKERDIVGYSGKLGLLKLYLPLSACAVVALLPALSYFGSFLSTTSIARFGLPFFIFGAAATFAANEFMAIFTVLNKAMGAADVLYSKLTCCRTQESRGAIKARYALHGRYLEIINAVQLHIARRAATDRRNGAEFPEELNSLIPTSRNSPNQWIANVIIYARKHGLIHQIEHPNPRDVAVDTVTRYAGHGAAIAISFNQVGSFYAIEALFHGLAHAVPALAGLGNIVVKNLLSATIDVLNEIFIYGFLQFLVNNTTNTATNAVRYKFDTQQFALSWLYYVAPKLYYTALGGAVGISACSFALAVHLINKIPDVGAMLLDFIPITPGLKAYCKFMAYAGVPLVNSTVAFLGLVWAFKKLSRSLGNLNERNYAQILDAFDRHTLHVNLMPKKIFIEDLRLLETIDCYLKDANGIDIPDTKQTIAEAIGSGLAKLHGEDNTHGMIRTSEGRVGFFAGTNRNRVTDATPLTRLNDGDDFDQSEDGEEPVYPGTKKESGCTIL